MILPMDVLITFFAASVLLAVVPGPDNIFVLTQSALYGRISGIIVMLGLCTGLLFHTAAVSFGVAIIFKTSKIAFTILKITGAAYLLYLAWMSFKAKPTDLGEGENKGLSTKKLYTRGIIMNITNPKVSIFFMAFLPQFTDPSRGPISIQMVLLGLIFIVSTFLIFGIIALLAGALGEWFNNSKKAQVILNKIAGSVFVGLALKLAVTER